MDSDDEHDLAMRSGEPTDKAAYAHEVQDAESSDDEQSRGLWRPLAPAQQRQTTQPTFSAAAHPAIVSAASAAAAAAASSASSSSGKTVSFSTPAPAARAAPTSSVSGATVLHSADDDELEGYEDEDASEDEASEEEDDDEELGGNEGDRRFQAMIEQMQSKGGAGDAQEPDLLSQILKGGSSSWKPSHRADAEAGDDEDNAARVAEEQIDYQIYSDSLLLPLTNGAAEIELAALRTAILQFMAPTTADYVWQKDGMRLQVCAPHMHAAPAAAASASASSMKHPHHRSAFASKHASSHSQLIPHLHGTCHFGDNVEDEWFIVYLLLALSSHYADLSICVSDSDGSFLCIELAEQLPEWLKPESAMHRVWIRRGQVHLIPMPQTPAQVVVLPTRPTIDQALKLLNSQAVPTAASSAVQTALLQKLEPFFRASAAAAPSFSLASPSLSASHHARVALPLSLALLLARYPQLVAEWIHNFFYRDAIDMKKANKMERVFGHAKRKAAATSVGSNGEEDESKMQDEADSSSSAAPAAAASSSSSPTEESAVPFVFLRVRFTHCLYAQLIQQRFAAPRVFARHLSALTSALGSSATSPLVARALDLGVKLTTGAEMWFHNQKSEVARQLTKVTVARTKLGPQHPDLVRRDEAARVALAASSQQFHSVAEIERFLGANAAKDQQTAVLEQWRTFSAAVDTRQVAALFSTHSGSPACNSPIFYRLLIASFLYLCYQPHQCVDHEGADEMSRDPTQLPLFDPARSATQPEAQEGRIDNPINLPFTARVLELIEQLTAAYHTQSAESTAIPASFASLAAALQSTSFASLPRDDPDDWLTLTPAQLESMLSKVGSAAAAESARADQKGDYDGAAIVDSMHRFVGKVSELEGVEAPKGKGTAVKSANASAKAAAPSRPAQPQSRPVNVDSDELMRLLAGAQASFAAAVPAPAASPDSAMVDVPAPAPQPKKKPAASIWDQKIDEPIDPRDPPPTKQTTRPPANDPYATAFGSSMQESMLGAPPAQASPAAAANQPTPATSSAPKAPVEPQPQLRDYMEAMDDELQQAGVSHQQTFRARCFGCALLLIRAGRLFCFCLFSCNPISCVTPTPHLSLLALPPLPPPPLPLAPQAPSTSMSICCPTCCDRTNRRVSKDGVTQDQSRASWVRWECSCRKIKIRPRRGSEGCGAT